ncbi:MAG TPA: DUF6073 family protein [Solirubrobacteraceae bacterium]|jgi:hypothetical protein|nr:DUF6073 family protein [Solirubrobacteraceae bacterium]
MATEQARDQFAYGPRIDLTQLEDLYEGAQVEQYRPPEGGIDNLGIRSVDTFMVPGLGESTVEFRGYVRVARSQPTTTDWASTEVYTNMIEMYMSGESPELGTITVRLQPETLSTGCIHTPFEDGDPDRPEKACRMAVGAIFEVPKLGLRLFNKEPVVLTIDNVRSIPPAGNPGRGQIYRMLPLYDREDPEGKPVAYLTSLNFAMGTYLPPAEVAELASA